MSFRLSKSLVLTPIAAAACILTTGCANMVTTASTTNAFSTLGTTTGQLHGGSQGISGATVNLYSAGITGYGKGSTLLATTTSSNDGTGSFGFSQVATQPGTLGQAYACPNSKSLIYAVAIGGNTQASGVFNNAASVMIAPVGACGTAASKFIDINEVTTAATVTALAQYINPGTTTAGSVTIGTNGDYTAATVPQAGTGLVNAFNTIANLANVPAGTAVTSATATGTSTAATGAVVTITPETAKINTIANILAACVNSTASNSANCTTLFSNATPPAAVNTSQPTATFATAVDTLQAAYYMATNPIDDTPATTSTYPTNITNLYNLQAAAGAPFAPTLTAVPTDWTIGISYSSGTTTCANGALFINYPYANSIDKAGNIWMANGGSSTAGATTEMSPTGLPLNCSGTTLGSRGGATIDTAGNVWSVNSATTPGVVKFDGTTTTTIPVGTAIASNKPYAITADGKGNVFFTDSVALTLSELPSTATASTAPTVIGSVTGSSPYFIAIGGNNTVVIGQSGASGSTITAYPTTIVGGSSYSATPVAVSSTADYAGVYGIAFDNAGGFYVGNSAGTSGAIPGNTTSRTALSFSSVNPGDTNTVTFTQGTPTAQFAGGLSTARIIAIDGAGNIWYANNTAASSGLYAVSEFNKSLVALSPSSTGTTAATQNGGFQKAATFFTGLRGMAIDPSGNVWTSSTASTTNTIITEIVGAAVPVITPISAQIAGGTFATKP